MAPEGPKLVDGDYVVAVPVHLCDVEDAGLVAGLVVSGAVVVELLSQIWRPSQ